MRISTMTSDYDRFCDTLEEKIDHIHRAGFRYIDINLYDIKKDDPLLVSANWQDNAKRLREYAESKGMSLTALMVQLIEEDIKNSEG